MFKKFLLVMLGFAIGELITNYRLNVAANTVQELDGMRQATLRRDGWDRFTAVEFKHNEHVYCSKSCKQR